MIFLILGEDAEKAFVKLRDQCVRAKRELKKSRDRVLHLRLLIKEILGSLKFLGWLDSYAKPRLARSNVGDKSDEDNEEITYVKNNLNFTQSDGESDKDLSPQSVTVTSTKIKSSTLREEKISKRSKKPSTSRIKELEEEKRIKKI